MNLINKLGLENFDYYKYYKSEMAEKGLDLGFSEKSFSSQKERSPFANVDPNSVEAFPREGGDLVRIHYLIRQTKTINALEIGLGESTNVILHALSLNEEQYQNEVNGYLRRVDPFTLHSIETSEFWLNQVKKNILDKYNNKLHITHASCYHGTFNDRICTYFETFPNISPDFIYLDGPDQFNVGLNVDGFSTRHPERMPMSGDLLRIEHFLVPGCLILIDGRTANARFLKANFQCKWQYSHFVNEDIHIFIKDENPLGVYNAIELKFKNLITN